MKQLDPAAPPCVCDHLLGIECGHHLGLTERVRHEGFEPVARAVGWIPLAEVLDALRDWKAYGEWVKRTLAPRAIAVGDIGSRESYARYLAERFAGSPRAAAEPTTPPAVRNAPGTGDPDADTGTPDRSQTA